MHTTPTPPPTHHARSWVTSLDALRAVVGAPSPAVHKKLLGALEAHSRRFIAQAPLCAWSVAGGRVQTALGAPGWAEPLDDTRVLLRGVALDPSAQTRPAGSLWLIPGVRETLRVNGVLAPHDATSAVLHVKRVFLQCPKAFVRSGAWEPARWDAAPSGLTEADAASSLSADMRAFAERASLALVATEGDGDRVDVSPRGDPAGRFVRVLDAQTLLLPDRTGNRLVDTLTNLTHTPRLSMALMCPGCDDALVVAGAAHITDDAEVLAASAVKKRRPRLGVVVALDGARPRVGALAGLWSERALVAPGDFPSMGAMILDQVNPNGGALNRIGSKIFDLASAYHTRKRLY